ncbi:DsbA family protein [Streptomyces sp. NPDC002346]
MSENNQEGKRAARDRLIQQREQEKARERRRRTLIVSTAVVGVLALAAVIGVIAANSGGKGSKASKSGPAVAPSGATGKDSLAIQVGANDAPSTLTVWEDFRCPVCGQFENAFRDTIHELENTGQLKVLYHLVTLIDGNLGGSGSLDAANAAACAQDVGKFSAYHDVLYRNQPPETDDAFGKSSKLIELAGKVEGVAVGVRGPGDSRQGSDLAFCRYLINTGRPWAGSGGAGSLDHVRRRSGGLCSRREVGCLCHRVRTRTVAGRSGPGRWACSAMA